MKSDQGNAAEAAEDSEHEQCAWEQADGSMSQHEFAEALQEICANLRAFPIKLAHVNSCYLISGFQVFFSSPFLISYGFVARPAPISDHQHLARAQLELGLPCWQRNCPRIVQGGNFQETH